ncbi:MAG: hypothetical protein V4645_10080 [Pseudomonadota bacterium]
MSTAQHMPRVRPSRTYKNGIGKPVVAKRWDDIAQAHQWDVVFRPCNSFGCWVVAPEARLVDAAQNWCFRMNYRLAIAAKVTGSAA